MFMHQPVYRKRYDMGLATNAKANRVFPAYCQRGFNKEVAKLQRLSAD